MYIEAVLGALRKIGLDRLLGAANGRCRDLVQALIVSRVIAPASKPATAAYWRSRSSWAW